MLNGGQRVYVAVAALHKSNVRRTSYKELRDAGLQLVQLICRAICSELYALATRHALDGLP